jgi:hypothetical protein
LRYPSLALDEPMPYVVMFMVLMVLTLLVSCVLI